MKTLPKLNLSHNAIAVLEKRYLKRDINATVVETPDDMFRRVAKAVAKAEYKYGYPKESVKQCEKLFYELLASLDFMPNSPTLMNAGRELGQLMACFVLPVGDSMEEIFDSVKHMALVQKSGGGTGFSFSNLRPEGDRVKSTSGVSSGPISFMKVFNAATDVIKQGGTRRGANMGVLRVDHPDIIKFIMCKSEEGEVSNFNVSVGITHEFMQAAIEETDYDLINPRDGSVAGRLNAKEILELIAKMAHRNGEPGIIFIDNINQHNPTPELGDIEATNPCGETPLLPNEACVLGSINLANMVRDGDIHWHKLDYTARMGVRFLDNVIDVSEYPLEVIKDCVMRTRKIGMGIMGFHEMLIKMGIPYDSEQAVRVARKVMQFIHEAGHDESRVLAFEKGTFPAYKGSIFDKINFPVRNATITTIAPTGTISLICGTSSGIEPIFAIAMTRKHDIVEEEMIEVNSLFANIARRLGFHSPKLMEKVAKYGGVGEIDEMPEDIRRVFVTASEVSVEWHLRIQAAFQEFTDNAVSKTINMPNDATVEDVYNAYLLAYELGCKGLTIYRDGSRSQQVLNKGTKPLVVEVPKVKAPEPEGKAYTCPSCGNVFQVYQGSCAWCNQCGTRECN